MGRRKAVVAPEFGSVVGSPARRRWVERSLCLGAAIALSTALLSSECDDMDGRVVHNGYAGLMLNSFSEPISMCPRISRHLPPGYKIQQGAAVPHPSASVYGFLLGKMQGNQPRT